MFKIFLHNICGYGRCQATDYKGCQHLNYFLGLNKKEYKLPKIINKIIILIKKEDK